MIAWRFLTRNHRIVARSPQGFPDPEQAAAAIALVRLHAPDAALDFSSDRGGMWRWTLRLETVPIAMSAHPYGRRREADSAAQRFRAAAGGAVVDAWVAERGEHRPRSRTSPHGAVLDLGARSGGTVRLPPASTG